MKFDLVRPCEHCPFRTDIQPYLRKGSAQRIAGDMIERDGTFACHKTVFYNDDHPEGLRTQNTQHCAGALIVLMKIEMPNQLMRIAGRIRVFDAGKLAMDAPVFDTIEDFIDAQKL